MSLCGFVHSEHAQSRSVLLQWSHVPNVSRNAVIYRYMSTDSVLSPFTALRPSLSELVILTVSGIVRATLIDYSMKPEHPFGTKKILTIKALQDRKRRLQRSCPTGFRYHENFHALTVSINRHLPVPGHHRLRYQFYPVAAYLRVCNNAFRSRSTCTGSPEVILQFEQKR